MNWTENSEGMYMTNEHMKKRSIHLALREMRLKLHGDSIWSQSKCCHQWKQKWPPMLRRGRGNLQCWRDFKMVQPLAKSDLPFLSFYSRTWKSAHHKVPFPAMLWLHNVQQTKHAISPEVHQQRSETSVLDPMQFYSATKRRELWCFQANW